MQCSIYLSSVDLLERSEAKGSNRVSLHPARTSAPHACMLQLFVSLDHLINTCARTVTRTVVCSVAAPGPAPLIPCTLTHMHWCDLRWIRSRNSVASIGSLGRTIGCWFYVLATSIRAFHEMSTMYICARARLLCLCVVPDHMRRDSQTWKAPPTSNERQVSMQCTMQEGGSYSRKREACMT